MNPRILEEYLIALGFKVDDAGLSKFKGTLELVSRQVEDHTAGIAKMFVGTAATVVAAYVSISAAVLGLADHVAQSEIGFQLFALRMHMSVTAAKELKIATDALGYSLDEIAWNPELRARYFQLIKDQSIMQRGLGTDYDAQMKNIRDIRFELTRLQVESKYLAMGIVEAIAKSFGLGEGGLLRKLEELNGWIISHIPEISEKISTYLVPILRETWDTIKHIGSAFLEFVGFISGDKRLADGTLSIKAFAIAFQDLNQDINKVVTSLEKFIKWFDSLPKPLRDAIIGAAVGAVVAGPYGALAGGIGGLALGVDDQQKAAMSPEERAVYDAETQRRKDDISRDWQWLTNSSPSGNAAITRNPFNDQATKQMSPNQISSGKASIEEGKQGEWLVWQKAKSLLDWRENALTSRNQIIKMVSDAANKYNVPPEIALAVAKNESNFNESARSKTGAIGVMQLMPGTARDMNVNPYMAGENITGGVKYLKKLFDDLGDWSKAIAAYNAGEARIKSGQSLPAETRAYLQAVQSDAGKLDVGGIQIYINNPNATPEQIAAIVHSELDRKLTKTHKTNIAQTAGSM
jgi:hypothetical protein